MNLVSIKGFPHFAGVWSADYNDGNGYRIGAEVYGPEVDSLGNHIASYRSLIADNTQPLTDETAWMSYSNQKALEDYLDLKFEDYTQPLVKERITLTLTTDYLYEEGQDIPEPTVKVVDEDENILFELNVPFGVITNIDIMPGTKYQLRLQSIPGCVTPRQQGWVYASNNTEKVLNIQYKKFVEGVAICTTDYQIIDPSAWESSGKTINDVLGIYICVNSTSNPNLFEPLVLSLPGVNGSGAAIGTKSYAVLGTADYLATKGIKNHDSGLANLNYAKENYLLENFPAMHYASSFKWPVDNVISYLPSMGELLMIYKATLPPADDISDINKVTEVLGLSNITFGGSWWSSTCNTESYAWCLYNSSPFYYGVKSDGCLVRAVAAFNPLTL